MPMITVPLISLGDCVFVQISDEEAWILEKGSEISKSTVLSLVCGRARDQYLNKVHGMIDGDLVRYRITELLRIAKET